MSSTEAVAGTDSGALLLNQPVVIDNGTASIKAGFAGSSKPKVRTLRGVIAAPKIEPVGQSLLTKICTNVFDILKIPSILSSLLFFDSQR